MLAAWIPQFFDLAQVVSLGEDDSRGDDGRRMM